MLSGQSMTRLGSASKQVRWGSMAMVIAMVILHLCSAWLAVSPVCHENLHPDAANPNHHCAVTAITGGQMLHSTVAVIVPAEHAPHFALLLPQADRPSVFVSFLPPGRGPPAA